MAFLNPSTGYMDTAALLSCCYELNVGFLFYQRHFDMFTGCVGAQVLRLRLEFSLPVGNCTRVAVVTVGSSYSCYLVPAHRADPNQEEGGRTLLPLKPSFSQENMANEGHGRTRYYIK